MDFANAIKCETVFRAVSMTCLGLMECLIAFGSYGKIDGELVQSGRVTGLVDLGNDSSRLSIGSMPNGMIHFNLQNN